ncbi:MAG: carboxypeptidase-like regulatory domain-containing protein [Patescibacteria group bacterium]
MEGEAKQPELPQLPPLPKFDSAWTGTNISTGIIFVYIAFFALQGAIFSYVQLSPIATSLFSFILGIVAIFAGSIFGVKYVISRTEIDPNTIKTISAIAAFVPTIVNLFTSGSGALLFTIFAGGKTSFTASLIVQDITISVCSIAVIFAATFISLKRYINLPKGVHYISNKHMYTLLFIIIASFGIQYWHFYQKKSAEKNNFIQKYGTLEDIQKNYQQEEQKLRDEYNQIISQPPTASTTPTTQATPGTQPPNTAPKQANPLPPPTIHSGFTGEVSSEAGEIIVGAKIKFTSADGKINKETTSDADGRYEISLSAGKYSVLATHPGFEFSSYPGYFIIANGIEVANIEMTVK